ncbi:hypothetical protein DYB32_000620 [Aphanomyces invadans]|uniref:Amino acid permease/ SLC12A domain-containing protein n=1 Tax=Aphanomyces invadans TaxID=157072 RepID=A0A3R6VHV6_9STRA|nr:hypothetical protein DYB32_000620 [Aphanomyces invadans]
MFEVIKAAKGVVDDRVWFVKSHYPERSGYVPVAVQKAILVVRNPWDAINSYFNMTLTNSHNKSVHDSMYCRFATRWDAMIQNEIQIWMKFHAYWIAKVDIPIQIVRYEDLLLHRYVLVEPLAAHWPAPLVLLEAKPLLSASGADAMPISHHRMLEMDDSQHAYTPFQSLSQKDSSPASSSMLNQLGTFNGVYVPCLLNIIGVILFLRLGWAIGQAGVVGMLTIFFFAELQAVLTVLSASAIASNGAMRGGGSYYLISVGKSIPVGSLAAVVTACLIYISLIFLFGASFDGVALRTNFSFFQQVGPTPYVIITGILVSCYTSGLGALFGASRILQAIARDNLFYGSAQGDEPQYAVGFTAVLSLVFIFIGDLDVLAPICTSFFCVAYAAVNFTSLVLQVTGVPNFRPTFGYSCWPLSLLGVAVNLCVMVYLNAMYAAVTFLVVTALFVYLSLAGPETSWGNVSQALMYHQVRKYLLRLDTRKGHVKFWRPAILFVPQNCHGPSVALCNRLKKGGLYIVGDIVLGEFGTATAAEATRRFQRWLDVIDSANLKAIPQVRIVARTQRGNRRLGPGTATSAEFVGILNDALLLKKNLVVFRHCDKVDPGLLHDSKALWVPSARRWRLDGVVKTVDVWITERSPWTADGGATSHVTLMLQLAHVMQSNVQWKGLPIRLLRACEGANDADTPEHLIHIASELRIALHATHAMVVPLAHRRRSGPLDLLVDMNRVVHDVSRDAGLVVLTLPDPTTFSSQPDEFAARLDALTKGLPPIMMVWSADVESVITTCI